MKRTVIFLFFCLLALGGLRSQGSFTVNRTDGTAYSVALDSNGGFYFDNGNLRIVEAQDGNATTEPLSTLRSIAVRHDNAVATVTGTSQLTLFPNPSSDYIVVDGATGEITVFSIGGVKMLTGSQGRLDISSLPRGLYVVHDGTRTAKFVKK